MIKTGVETAAGASREEGSWRTRRQFFCPYFLHTHSLLSLPLSLCLCLFHLSPSGGHNNGWQWVVHWQEQSVPWALQREHVHKRGQRLLHEWPAASACNSGLHRWVEREKGERRGGEVLSAGDWCIAPVLLLLLPRAINSAHSMIQTSATAPVPAPRPAPVSTTAAARGCWCRSWWVWCFASWLWQDMQMFLQDNEQKTAEKKWEMRVPSNA